MNSNLELYKNLYRSIGKIEKLYKTGFSLDRIKCDIVESRYLLNESQIMKEYEELNTLECVLASTLIGLNREKLERANSNTEKRTLFQYKGYESDMKIFYNKEYSETANETCKKLCHKYNFNPSKQGCFPDMLEIIKDDNKNRPYDYVSKIRNALLHGEYYLENSDILHITNHDDNGNVIFESKVLIFSLLMFVRDFFENNSVNSSYFEYCQLNMSEFKNYDDIMEFLKEFICDEIKFTKIPESAKFNGKNALYARLNSCFGLDSFEISDIDDLLLELKKEGFEYEITSKKLNPNYVYNIYDFLIKYYKHIYNNSETINILAPLVKLQFSPISEITNCISNIVTFISLKKDYMLNGSFANKDIIEELKFDEYCDAAFMYAITLIKANIINYVIECSEFEDIDFSLLDTSDIVINDIDEFNRRKNKYILDGFEDKVAHNKVILEVIRNSLAHGADRVKVCVDEDLIVGLIDVYPNVPNLGIITSLNTLNKILSSDIFNPINIKEKKKGKMKTL